MKIIQPWHIIAFILGILSLLTRKIFQKYPDMVESVYSGKIYPIISKWISLPAKWISTVSVSEAFILLCVIILLIHTVYGFFFIIKYRLSIFRWLLIYCCNLIAIACIGFTLYLWVWGFNYQRKPLSASMNIKNLEHLPSNEMNRFTEHMINIVNRFSKPTSFKDRRESLETIICQDIQQTISKFKSINISQFPNCPRTKPLILNELMNAFGISGIFLPIFLEPHINQSIMEWEVPFVMAHEKAHAIGYASEIDANIIAYITCLTSKSEEIRYSGALKMLVALYSVYKKDDWMKNIFNRLSSIAQSDISEMNRRIMNNYRQYEKIILLSKRVNDIYLKFNQQKLGIQSYEAAIPVVVAWWNTQTK